MGTDGVRGVRTYAGDLAPLVGRVGVRWACRSEARRVGPGSRDEMWSQPWVFWSMHRQGGLGQKEDRQTREDR